MKASKALNPALTGIGSPALRSLDSPSVFATLYALLSLLTVHEIPSLLLAFVAALIVPGLVLGRRVQTPLYHQVWNWAALAFISLIVVARFFEAVSSPVTLVFICLFLLLHKWFNPRGLREHVEIWCLTSLVLLVGALQGRGLFGLFVFLGWGISSIQLFNLIAVLRSHIPRKGKPTSPYQFASHSLRGVWAMVPLMALASAAVFLLSPRLRPPEEHPTGRPLNQMERSIVRAGFSESVNLRSLTAIQQTDGVAFRVIDPPAHVVPGQLRFRVATLDDFDGWEWKRLPDDAEEDSAVDLTARQYRLPTLTGDDAIATSSALMDWYYIRLVDFPGRSLPMPEGAIAIGGINVDVGLELGRDGRVSVARGTVPREYQVVSNPFSRDGRGTSRILRGEPMPQNLHVPSSLVSDLGGAARLMIPATADTPLQKARHLSAYLRRNGRYSLNLEGIGEGPEAIHHFLSNSLEGHCELYATAMALVLRTQGVPTRLVTGFNGAEYGAPYYGGDHPDVVVGQKNAHAWVEVYDKGEGWVAFDPTPAPLLTTNPDVASGGLKPFFQSNTKALSAIIEGYDYTSQQRFIASMKAGVTHRLTTWEHGALVRIWRRFKTNIFELPILGLAFVLAVLNGVAWMVHLRRGQRQRDRAARLAPGSTPERPAPRLFVDILRSLRAESAGTEVHESAQDLIFLHAELNQVPTELAERLSALYSQWRFGGRQRETEREIRRLLREMRGA